MPLDHHGRFDETKRAQARSKAQAEQGWCGADKITPQRISKIISHRRPSAQETEYKGWDDRVLVQQTSKLPSQAVIFSENAGDFQPIPAQLKAAVSELNQMSRSAACERLREGLMFLYSATPQNDTRLRNHLRPLCDIFGGTGGRPNFSKLSFYDAVLLSIELMIRTTIRDAIAKLGPTELRLAIQRRSTLLSDFGLAKAPLFLKRLFVLSTEAMSFQLSRVDAKAIAQELELARSHFNAIEAFRF